MQSEREAALAMHTAIMRLLTHCGADEQSRVPTPLLLDAGRAARDFDLALRAPVAEQGAEGRQQPHVEWAPPQHKTGCAPIIERRSDGAAFRVWCRCCYRSEWLPSAAEAATRLAAHMVTAPGAGAHAPAEALDDFARSWFENGSDDPRTLALRHSILARVPAAPPTSAQEREDEACEREVRVGNTIYVLTAEGDLMERYTNTQMWGALERPRQLCEVVRHMLALDAEVARLRAAPAATQGERGCLYPADAAAQGEPWASAVIRRDGTTHVYPFLRDLTRTPESHPDFGGTIVPLYPSAAAPAPPAQGSEGLEALVAELEAGLRRIVAGGGRCTEEDDCPLCIADALLSRAAAAPECEAQGTGAGLGEG